MPLGVAVTVPVAALGDVDWSQGRLRVLGKGRCETWLPLPQEVGDAMLQYLEWARILVENPLREIWRRAHAKIRRDLRRLAQTLALAHCRARRRTIPHALRDEWLTRAFLWASARYDLRPFPGRFHLFRARETGELFAGVQDDLGGLAMERAVSRSGTSPATTTR